MSGKIVHSVEAGQQISVFLDDRPGTLAEVAKLLGDRGVNILALSLAEGLGHGYVRMVVDKTDEALEVLKGAEELTMQREVLLLELNNAPGSLAAIAEKLSAADINIEYAYCAAGRNVDRGLVVVRVNKTAEALQSLKD